MLFLALLNCGLEDVGRLNSTQKIIILAIGLIIVLICTGKWYKHYRQRKNAKTYPCRPDDHLWELATVRVLEILPQFKVGQWFRPYQIFQLSGQEFESCHIITALHNLANSNQLERRHTFDAMGRYTGFEFRRPS